MPATQSSVDSLPPDRRNLPPDDPNGGDLPQHLSGGKDVEEYLEIGSDDDNPEIIEDGEGGLLITIDDGYEATPPNDEFYANLANTIPDGLLNKIATDLLRKIEEDKEARKKRDEQYEEGIRRTGLGKDAPGGAEFEGASRVVHPMLTEACIDYESRVIKELWPPSGPVKPKIIGAVTPEKTERANRKVEHMNWQITTQIEEARAVMETLLTQVPLGGSQFLHQNWSHQFKRPRWEFVPVDRCYLPFSAASWHSAHRRTISWSITGVEFKERVDSGLYKDLKLVTPSERPDQSKTQKANDKVEGVEEPGLNIDGDREIYETMQIMEVTEDFEQYLEYEEVGTLYPYLISVDVTTKQVLSVYRDWEIDDKTRRPIEHTFEFSFIPWRGAYSIGFPQIIGGLSGAATGALRALLDAAFISNTPGGLILKGSGTSGQTRRPQPGEFMELEGGVETDDIRKKVMPYTFNQPSPILFQLLGFLVDAGKGTVRTSLDDVSAPVQANTPVGTTMARVEEGLVVFSSIHGRIHAAFNRVLMGLARLNKLYLPEKLEVDAEGKEILVYRKDYEGPCDVQPTSDPTIFSDTQRFAQDMAIQQRASTTQGLYKPRSVEERWLRRMKVSQAEIDEILIDAPQPTELNAVNENLAMAMGKPVSVFPEQDHLAHLQVLLDFMKSPILGANPLIAPKYLAAALQHAAEHILYWYVKTTTVLVTKAAGRDAGSLASSDETVKAKLDQLLAMASQFVVPQVQQSLGGVMPVLQQAMQMMKQFQPPPAVDPGAAALQIAQGETQQRAAAAQASTQVQLQKNQIMADRNQIDRQEIDANNATKQATTAADNQTAMDIATLKLGSGMSTSLKNGESLSTAP